MGDLDPAAISTLPTAVRSAYDAAERAGQRVRLGNVNEFDLVVLGPTDAGKTTVVTALLADAVGAFVGLAERPGRGTTTPVEYVYGEAAALWFGVGGTWGAPADWIQAPIGTRDVADVADLRRVRVVAPAKVLHDWNIRIVDCPGFEQPEDLTGPIMAEALRADVGVIYVMPRRGITEVDAQALEMLRHTPTVLVENRRDAEIVAESTADELAFAGLNTGLAVPIAARRLTGPGPERESLRRCVALLRTRTAPARWTSTVHAAALRGRDTLCADYARRQTMALMARHPDWLGSLHLLADLLSVERDGPAVIDLAERLTEIAALAEAAQPATTLRTLIDEDARSALGRYNEEAMRHSPKALLNSPAQRPPVRFGQTYAEVRDDLLAILDNLLADAALRVTEADEDALEGTRSGVLADQLEIAVLGQSSAGKSALINALLGVRTAEEFLPTSARPTTMTVNEVRYSPLPSLSATWLRRVDLRLLSPGAEPNQVRIHVDEIRALARWLRDRSVLARDCVFHPLVPDRAARDGEASFWRLWEMLDLTGEPQLHAYLAPSPDRPRLADITVPAEVSVQRFATAPNHWPGKLDRQRALAEIGDEPALALRVDTLRLGFPHPLLKHVTIIDTPGTDAPVPHHRIAAHRAVRDKRQCAVIYCFDGARPASHEDNENLAFLRDCKVGTTDLSRFFFAITRKSVAEKHAVKVRATVDQTLVASGVETPRIYFTEVLTDLNDDFRTLAADLDQFVLRSKSTLLRSWITHAHQVVEDIHRRHRRVLDGIADGEQNRLEARQALQAEAAAIADLQIVLATSGWGEQWLRNELTTTIGQGAARVGRHLADLVDRAAFERIRDALAADIEELNAVTRGCVMDGCATVANRLAAEVARRLPRRRISSLPPNPGDEFFAVAEVDHAIGLASWRTGRERIRGLLSRDGWKSDPILNRERIEAAWNVSRDNGWQEVIRIVDQYLAHLRTELARIADSVAAEFAASADVQSPSDHPSSRDHSAATDGSDRALTWLQRLDALSRTCTEGES